MFDLPPLPWSTFGLCVLVAGLIFLIWRMDKGGSQFSIADSLIDQTTGHTSYLRIIVFCSFIGAWGVALWYMVEGENVQTYVLSILAIFVTNVLSNRIAENFDPRVKATAFNTAPDMPAPLPPDPAPATATATTNITVPAAVPVAPLKRKVKR